MPDKKIEALKLAAETKKQDALFKTEAAIETLVKNNHKITVRSVATEAGVSVSYIYKYPELAYKIQTLREQQKYNLVKPQAPSSKTHQIIATQLRNRIKIVEAQKAELSNEIKILIANIDKMSESENPLERLQAQNIKLIAENKNLQQQLQQYEQEICQLRDFILKGHINKRDSFSDK